MGPSVKSAKGVSPAKSTEETTNAFTNTAATTRSSDLRRTSGPRPFLQYRPTLLPSTADTANDILTQFSEPQSPKSTSHANRVEERRASAVRGEGKSATVEQGRASPNQLEIQRLKDAMNAKLLLSQERARRGVSSPPNSSILAARRISPVAEQPSDPMSPSVEAVLSSPLPTGSRTTSTESTESSKTVRGSVPATPFQYPLRTPSYPFPYVPAVPQRKISPSFHQPFTTLSPTISSAHVRDAGTPRDRINSVVSTPASATTFMPPGSSQGEADDPRYPSPNTYDLVLSLNAEPDLDSWWSNVVRIMQEWYKAERVTLAVPTDPTDIQNVPWCQKASFNILGKVGSATSVSDGGQRRTAKWVEKAAPRVHLGENDQIAGHNKLGRPKLEFRHSFAGYGVEREEAPLRESKTPVAPIRPRGPLRTASYVPTRAEHAFRSVASDSADTPSHVDYHLLGHSTYVEPELSSVAESSDHEPYLRVFKGPRPLDQEEDALIDASSVLRIVEKGGLVTLTREYSVLPHSALSRKGSISSTKESNGSSGSGPTQTVAKFRTSKGNGEEWCISTQPTRGAGELGDPTALTKRTSSYEEFEQLPSSPWAQSPAPSPAIQVDESSNPFFTAASVEEQSFDPVVTIEDYSQYRAVEAIGVDNSKTITHIPLIHPLYSQTLHAENVDPTRSSFTKKSSNKGKRYQERQEKAGKSILCSERKAPIAIISTASSTVPFPQNLAQSLKLLAPHLATSFSNAYQYTAMHNQMATLRHRRVASLPDAATTSDPATFSGYDGLLATLDLEDLPSSIGGSMTSPSDCSGRSRHSPGGSIAGTPGWDISSVGFPNKQSVVESAGVRTGMEAIDSYFDAKKRGNTGRTNSAAVPGHSITQQQASARTAGRPGVHDHRNLLRRIDPALPEQSEDPQTPRSAHGARAASRESTRPPRDSDKQSDPLQSRGQPAKLPLPQLPEGGHHRHSQLHSYGADFTSSFQTLPAGTALTSEPHNVPQSRSTSSSEPQELLQPSERLLRTIIDALPVQIFTAHPESGILTWVNSKYLVYRGQEAQQILQDPWQVVHPNDKDEYQNIWERSLRSGQQIAHKVRLKRFDGNYRWFFVRAAPLRDKRQRIVHWIGTNMDFHDQHVAEVNAAHQQELAASEAKYRTLANSSPQIVFAVNRTKGIIFSNTQWLCYSGQTEGEASGTGFMDRVHPEDLIKCKIPVFDQEGDNAVNVPTSLPPEPRRTVSSGESTVISSEGSEDTVTGTNPLRDSPFSMNMPQRKLSKLAETGILKASKDADGKPSYSTEVRLQSKEGEYRWHLVRVLLAESGLQADSEEETWYGTCTDINDHKLLEQTLKETMDAKSRFLSNMSHEIRTPLNGITGMVNFLIDTHLTSEQMEHVNIIRASTEGLRDLINDILDLSKVEAGMINLVMNWFHVRSIVEEVTDLTSALAIEKGIELNYVVEEDVPPMVKGDRFRIRQVLLNVIGNAIKFTQTGEVFVRCFVLRNRDYDLGDNEILLQFQVIDTGSGFNEQEAEYLFKRFSQIDASSTRQQGGTGLGLVISMQLVELHGGKMKAGSVPGKGSTFTFFLKLTLPSDEDQPPEPLSTPHPDRVAQPPIASWPASARAPNGLSKVAQLASTLGHGKEIVQSPEPYWSTTPDLVGRSPSLMSSGSSDPSIRTDQASIGSERSSASSYEPDPRLPTMSNISLRLPSDDGQVGALYLESASRSTDFAKTVRPAPSPSLAPPMYSILVVCPLQYSREATVKHIEMTVPKSVPSQIAAHESSIECQNMIGGEDPLIFTHIVLVLKKVEEIIAIMKQVFSSPAHISTALVVVSDLAQKRAIMQQAGEYDFDLLARNGRLRFIFKPLKPSKCALIFDPQKQREMSTDRNHDSAQQIVMNQKQVFDEVTQRLSNRGKKVLLVEDNKINQLVVLKFLKRVGIDVETVLDGVQCTESLFSKPHHYYSIILCDLHMPNKDGYQTCREIRRWERQKSYSPLPILALSANVLGDVYAKCVEAGFNSYLQKPIEFKELSVAMLRFLDPPENEKGNPIEFMKPRAAIVRTKRQ